jgi:hypothetical protein
MGMELVPCGRDIAKLIELFESCGVEHIDIAASPYDLS